MAFIKGWFSVFILVGLAGYLPTAAAQSCQCSDITSYGNILVESDATFCGMQICGLDNNLHQCTATGWQNTGQGPCGDGEANNACSFDLDACTCPNGAVYDPAYPSGIPIPVDSTYCGMTVCGADNQYYECNGGGWQALGNGPCAGASTSDLDNDALNDGLEAILAERYAPRFRLHLNDNYRPASVDWYLDRTQLRFSHGNFCSDHQILNQGQVDLFSLISQQHNGHRFFCSNHNGPQYNSGGATQTPFFLQIPNNANEMTTRRGSQPDDWACYAHVFPASPGNNIPLGHIDIQYWIFYPYNGPWGFLPAEHEGDWEHITVRLDEATLEPVNVYLAAHGGGERLFWDQMRCTLDDRPVAYSAINTHASYATEGSHSQGGLLEFRTDHTTLLGPIFDCTGRLQNMGEMHHPFISTIWSTYNGRWGELGSQVNGPYGPVLQSKWLGDPD
ncbi:MAG: hypothetical protein Tsb002_07900 [Wenzhouxiangellaceae bacterium]